MLAVVQEIVTEDKTRNNIIASIQKIPMSDTFEILSNEVFETLLEQLKKAEVMSLAVDESTDGSDVGQLCLYVRFRMLS